MAVQTSPASRPRARPEPAEAAAAALEPAVLSLGDAEWARFVAAHPAATPFHHPAWAQLLAQAYGYPGLVVAVADGARRIRAGMPVLEVRSLSRRRRWISLPFTDECPPLAADPAAGVQLTGALESARERAGAPEVQVRGEVDALRWRVAADAVIHELDLSPGIEHVRRGFSRSQVVRNIARGEREGVTVRRARDERDLAAFYRLHTRTRRRQGVPVQPRRFFELIWANLVQGGLGHILLADAGGREAVAGALFLTHGTTTIYKFGASDADSWPLRPNHVIFWTAIQQACAAGHRRLDFGRTDLDNHGLRAFKGGWGAVERPLRYSSLAARAPGTHSGLGRVLSAAVSRGPGWVCRAAGATLYRYAA